MIVRLLATAFVYLLPTASVDTILNGLTKFVARLAEAETQQMARSEALTAQANELLARAAEATTTADRAARVRKNLAVLTNAG